MARNTDAGDDPMELTGVTPPPEFARPLHQSGLRIVLMNWIPAKSFSLPVTLMQSFALAMAATIISRPLPGRPAALPSAISRAQMSPTLSSKVSIGPSPSQTVKFAE